MITYKKVILLSVLMVMMSTIFSINVYAGGGSSCLSETYKYASENCGCGCCDEIYERLDNFPIDNTNNPPINANKNTGGNYTSNDRNETTNLVGTLTIPNGVTKINENAL